MSIIEDALKLTTEEKVKLYNALHEDLNFENNIVAENELSEEQWAELKKRADANENGTLTKIAESDLLHFLQSQRNDLQSGNS